MNDAERHKLIWGWLRLCLGIAQMSLAAAGLGSLITVGLHPLTLILLFGATAATALSRILYQGKPDPRVGQEPQD